MTIHIILSAADAAAIKGASAALDPVELIDGSFVLPVEVLDDPAHASVRADLAAKPQRDVLRVEFQWYAEALARAAQRPAG